MIEVNVLKDGEPGSLRGALDSANVETSGPVRIEIRPGTYELTRCNSSGVDEDANTAGDLDITTDVHVTLSAPDGGVFIVQTCSSERVLDSHGRGALVLAGVTLSGGTVHGTARRVAAGAGVRAAGDVVLDHATVRDNRVVGPFGTVASDGSGATAGGPARGGGLHVGGSLIASGATLQANTAEGGEGRDAATTDGPAAAGGLAEGGGAYVVGRIVLSGGTVAGNRALGGRGGAGTVQAAGGDARGGGLAQALDGTSPSDASAKATEFSDNVATGGAITALTLNGGTAGDARGGALAMRNKVTLTDVTATQNSASSPLDGAARGGAVEAKEVSARGGVFYGNSATVTAATPYVLPHEKGPNDTAFGGAIGADQVSVSGATFTHNSSSNGGAVSAIDAVITDVSASDNTAANCGGALFASARLTLNRSRISENTSVACGGGVSADTLVVSDTLLFGNRVSGGAQTAPDAYFGLKPEVRAPAGAGAFANTRLEGRRVTFASNHFLLCASRGALGVVPVDAHGGGMAAASIDLVNVTVVDHTGGSTCAPSGASFMYYPPSGLAIHAETLSVDHATITDPVVAEHLVTHRSVVIGGINIPSILTPAPPGSIDASSYSFFWAGSRTVGSGPGDQAVAPETLLLAPLSDNGGLVPTRAPGAGSPLINAIPVTACGPTDDARGVTRPQGPGCDVGAVEVTL